MPILSLRLTALEWAAGNVSPAAAGALRHI
jgi:hypothetical protein